MNRMNRNKKISIIGSVVAVLVVVIVLGIAYAGFTEQLNINGEGIVKSSTWKIKFANLKEVELTGTAKEITKPSINSNDTKIGDYEVTLTSPGDSVSYSFEVVNEGTYDAKISSIYIPTPECTGSGDNAVNDAENVCNRLRYTLTYANGVKIQAGDTLISKATKKMRLTLTYDVNTPSNELAKSDVTVSNLGISIYYAQDGNAVEGSGSTQTYQVYSVGDQVQVAGENYYVIEDSGVNQDYVTLLKETPLTVDEVNKYGGVGTDNNHVNRYTYDSVGTAENINGYGGIAYYSSSGTCGYNPDADGYRWIATGCTNDYDKSDIKYVVDAWAEDKLSSVELKEVDNYKTRLITNDELDYEIHRACTASCYDSWTVFKYDWMYIDGYDYWSMTPAEDSSSDILAVSKSMGGRMDVHGTTVVRPVINVFKTAI